jgi:hypothetical protein
VALEIEGGLYIGGRHSRGAGAERDMEKYALALIAGWRVLRVSPNQLRTGQAFLWLAKLLPAIPTEPPTPDRPLWAYVGPHRRLSRARS